MTDLTQYTHDATSRTVSTPKGDLHYHEAGDGPPLVLLHGSGPGVSAWANFGDNLAAFAPHFRVLALDFPGFGISYPTEGSPLMAGVPAVVDFLDALGLDTVPIVGNSMGGNVGARVAANFPERVSRLVTIGGVGFGLFSPAPPEGVKLLVQFVEDPTRERLVSWMQAMVYDTRLLTDEFVDRRWQAANAPGALDDLRKLFNARSLVPVPAGKFAGEMVGMLGKIECPTLLTWGRDDRVTPVDGMLIPMRVIRRCEVHVFPDCGHWAMIERRAEFERVTLEFLQR